MLRFERRALRIMIRMCQTMHKIMTNAIRLVSILCVYEGAYCAHLSHSQCKSNHRGHNDHDDALPLPRAMRATTTRSILTHITHVYMPHTRAQITTSARTWGSKIPFMCCVLLISPLTHAGRRECMFSFVASSADVRLYTTELFTKPTKWRAWLNVMCVYGNTCGAACPNSQQRSAHLIWNSRTAINGCGRPSRVETGSNI